MIDKILYITIIVGILVIAFFLVRHHQRIEKLHKLQTAEKSTISNLAKDVSKKFGHYLNVVDFNNDVKQFGVSSKNIARVSVTGDEGAEMLLNDALIRTSKNNKGKTDIVMNTPGTVKVDRLQVGPWTLQSDNNELTACHATAGCTSLLPE